MNAIGIIGGTAFQDMKELKTKAVEKTHTPWGSPSSHIHRAELEDKEVLIIFRHGEGHDIPPHRVNNRANIYALQREVDTIIGVSSAGALSESINVPSISVPKDYVNMWNIETFYDGSIKHITPDLSPTLRKELIRSASEIEDIVVRTEDVYVQTSGPRLETKAEVKIIRSFGDLVGMTMAPEATLCKEINVDYASLVSVDNYANGLVDKKITYDEISETATKNREASLTIIRNLLKDRG